MIRSFDCGATWEIDSAAQLAAGGGQELGLIYLGKGKVGGALAAHDVAPTNERERAAFPNIHPREYPFDIAWPYGIYASVPTGGPHGARTAGCCAKRPMLTRVIRHLSSWTMGASSLHVMQKMLAVLRALPEHSGIRPSKWMSFLSRK